MMIIGACIVIRMTNVGDNNLESHSDDSRVIIYNCNMFIMPAPGVNAKKPFFL